MVQFLPLVRGGGVQVPKGLYHNARKTYLGRLHIVAKV